MERTDRLGRQVCTASIYATVATSYASLTRVAMAKDTAAAAAELYRHAARYNRAFAAALMCRGGDCGDAQAIWSKGSIWSE